MLLSFPEYFEVKEFWLDHRGFSMVALALPSFFYRRVVIMYQRIKVSKQNAQYRYCFGNRGDVCVKYV
jgi:Cu+-exporting ATPase